MTIKIWKQNSEVHPINVHTSPQWLSQTLSNSSETKTTLYTGPYRSPVGFFSPNSSVFLSSDAIACYSSEREKNDNNFRSTTCTAVQNYLNFAS